MSTDDVQRAALAERLAECGTIRPETLGYQRCERPAGHEGALKSQDRGEWDEPLVDFMGSRAVAFVPASTVERWIEEGYAHPKHPGGEHMPHRAQDWAVDA